MISPKIKAWADWLIRLGVMLFVSLFLAFFTNMISIAIMGRELAIQVNGGTVSLFTFSLNLYAWWTFFIIRAWFKRPRGVNNDE